jgi:hypothetical protein
MAEGSLKSALKGNMQDSCYGNVPMCRRAGCVQDVTVDPMPSIKEQPAAHKAAAEPAAAAACGAEVTGDADVGCRYVVHHESSMPLVKLVPVVIPGPETCRVIHNTLRMKWDWHFTAEQAAVPGVLKSEFTAEAIKNLVPGESTPPRFVILTDVHLLSTDSNAEVEFVAKADFIPATLLLLNGGQTGTFCIPKGPRSYGANEGRLQHLDDAVATEMLKCACLFGRDVKDLARGGITRVSDTTVKVEASSELAKIMEKWLPNVSFADPLTDKLMEEKMAELGAAIAKSKLFAITPNDMTIPLEPVKPATAANMLEGIFGTRAAKSDEREWYNKSANNLTVVIEGTLMILV